MFSILRQSRTSCEQLAACFVTDENGIFALSGFAEWGLVHGSDWFFPRVLQVETLMMAKDDKGRSILAAAVESGSVEVFGAVLSAIEGFFDGEV